MPVRKKGSAHYLFGTLKIILRRVTKILYDNGTNRYQTVTNWSLIKSKQVEQGRISKVLTRPINHWLNTPSAHNSLEAV